jgi:hypothetical protein
MEYRMQVECSLGISLMFFVIIISGTEKMPLQTMTCTGEVVLPVLI